MLIEFGRGTAINGVPVHTSSEVVDAPHLDTAKFVEEINFNIFSSNSNILFLISRNDNNTIYYQKDDCYQTQIRISDNHAARLGFLGFYKRVTDF